MITLTIPAMITFGVFLIAMVMIGVMVHGETSTFEDFSVGGRRLTAPVAALSAGASDMSGWLFLGLPGAVYMTGIGATWIAVGLIVGTYLNWRFVAPRLRTYTEQARAMGRLGAVRAVAQANANNVLAILIPCHRVLGADGRLTGYAGGLARKQWLLQHEKTHAVRAR